MIDLAFYGSLSLAAILVLWKWRTTRPWTVTLHDAETEVVYSRSFATAEEAETYREFAEQKAEAIGGFVRVVGPHP